MLVARSVLLRVVQAVLVVLAVSLINFALVRLAPGDPAVIMAGQSGGADAAYVSKLRQEFGLDHPLPTQLVTHFGQLARLDLGYSYRERQSVASLILERLPNTLLLTTSAFALALALGICVGAAAAARRGTWVDTALTGLTLLFYATPVFFVGLIMILTFSVALDWLPPFGSQTIDANLGLFGSVLDRLKYLAMPAMTLSLVYAATYARLTRSSVLEVLQFDFVKTARAKGLPVGRIQRSHVLRNALLPVITIAGIQAGQLIGGAVVVETVFGWPGIGRLAFDALQQRDYPVLMGVFLITSVLVVVFNVLTDICYGLFDPRMGTA